MRAEELSESIGLYIREHMLESEKSAKRMEEYIKHSDLNAGGNNYTRTLQIPKIYEMCIRDRKKLGFPVPITLWLKEDKYYNQVKEAFTSPAAKTFFNTDELVKLLDQHKNGKLDNSKKIWVVYMFLMWYDVYFVRENAAF